MADIRIPGDELEAAASNMEQVLALMAAGLRPPDLEQSLGGSDDVVRAAQRFDKRWHDGRTQLHDEAADIQKALKQVLDAFTQADQQTSSDLQS